MANDETKPAGEQPTTGERTGNSQIKAIASGVAKRTRQYFVRSQPSGPSFDYSSPNTARLSTVPSSAEEKYRGGQD